MDHISSQQFEIKVLKSNKPVLVDFFATWCGPCQMAMPILEKMSEKYKSKLDIFKVDIDKDQDIASKYGVMSIPTFIVFKNGKEIERKVGFPGEAGLEALIEDQIIS